MTLRRLLAAVALAAAVLLGAATPAGAHAALVSVDPPDGARLDESPDTVRLTFSEDVSVELGGVRVLDGDGEEVQEGAARADGAEVEVDVTPDLPDGTYVVSYRVVSADGHPVNGGSVFGVGDVEVDTGALDRVGGGNEDLPWDVAGAIGRGFAYLGVLVAAGGALFLTLVHDGGPERGRLRRVVRVMAVTGLVASFVALPVQAALGTGQGAASLFDDGVLSQVLTEGVGLALGLAVVGLALLLLLLDRRPRLAAAAGMVAAVSFAATGHTRAGEDAALATISDVVHLAAGAAWAGGLVLLALTVWARHRSEDDAGSATMALRFSDVATIAIVAVGISGGATAWTQLGSLDALTGTSYGQLLILKLVAVGGMAVAGAYNKLRLMPALRKAPNPNALRELMGTLQFEALVLVAVLSITAVLVVVTPGRTSADDGPQEVTAQLEGYGSVELTVTPAQVGSNLFHIYLFDEAGRPADLAEGLTISMRLPAADLGPIEREAARAGPSHFQLSTEDLAVAGTWQIDVIARIDRFTQVTGTTELVISG